MKSWYKIVVSNPGDLPFTVRTKFRSFDRASTLVRYYLRKNREVTLVELCEEGTIATWVYERNGRMIFDCNEPLAEKVG